MDRSIVKFAATLMLTTALAGCASDEPKNAANQNQTTPARGNTSAKSMAADLDLQIRSAQALREKGDFAGATKILSQLMLVEPDDARVVGEYGKNLVEQGRSKEALDFLKRAVQLRPGDWTFFSALGVAYDQKADYAAAKRAYQQALALKPGEPSVLNNYALSRMQAGDLAGARQLLAQASAAGESEPKIARNTQLLASLSPEAKPATQKAQPPSAPAQQTPPKTVAGAKTLAKTDAKKSEQASVKAAAAAPKTEERKTSAQATAALAKALGPNVVIQPVPKDPLAGPVKQATAAPRKLVKDEPQLRTDITPPPAATTGAANSTPQSNHRPAAPIAQDALVKQAQATPSKSAPAAPKDEKNKPAPAPSAKKPADAGKTPALRVTADVATP
jgi:Flp pilus assembly protein TadD